MDRANEFNLFYNRFDIVATNSPSSIVLTHLTPPCPHISHPSADLPPSLLAQSCPQMFPTITTGQGRRELRRVQPMENCRSRIQVLHLLRLQVCSTLDPLQFNYKEQVGGEDTIIYILHCAYSHLDKPGGAVRNMYLISPALSTPSGPSC